MRSYAFVFTLVALLFFCSITTQFTRAEFKTLNALDYPYPEAELGNFEFTIQPLQTTIVANPLTATPNSTASEQPPASYSPPKPFPMQLVYAITAIASAIAIVAITGVVLKKKLQ